MIRKIDDRTILTAKGKPVLVSLHMRPATTAPARIKAMLAIEHADGLVPMPFSEAVLGVDQKPHGFGIEFRLEQN